LVGARRDGVIRWGDVLHVVVHLGVGSSRYTATSGHCGATGTVWKNNGVTVGTETTRNWNDGQNDEALIPISSGGVYVWADPTTADRTVHAKSTSMAVGGLVCTDGLTDREVCSVKITSVGQTVNYGGATVKNLTGATQTAGRAAFSGGDSGGPVYTALSGGSVEAQGMIAAHSNATNATGWFLPHWTVTGWLGKRIALG
jgi:streptogrisin D